MILMDIKMINENINIGDDINIEFINSYKKYDDNNNLIITDPVIKLNRIIKSKIIILEKLGSGSYGHVYKILINDSIYALKLSRNERPNKMLKRYKSLIKIPHLNNYIVKIHLSGKMLNNSKIYYTIMDYGGDSLKKFNPTDNNINIILKQLYDIVIYSINSRILIPDFKLSNLTITDDLKVGLIDYYIKCKEYSPCFNCKIIRSFSCVEFEKERKIYENKKYNFTGIYIPFAICVINLLCKNSIRNCCDKINSNFNLNLEQKKIVLLLQIACYNYNNTSNNSIKKYKKIYKYKKSMEDSNDILKNNSFYEYFVGLLHPKEEFENIFNYKKISLIINDLMNLDPEQRSLRHISDKLQCKQH